MASSFNGSGVGGFEALQVAMQAATEVLRLLRSVKRGYSNLADQARRSATSAPLNLAEDSSVGGDPRRFGGERWQAGRLGGDRRHHFAIALGSAKEAAVAVELLREAGAVPAPEAAEALALQDRSIALCYRLVHPRR